MELGAIGCNGCKEIEGSGCCAPVIGVTFELPAAGWPGFCDVVAGVGTGDGAAAGAGLVTVRGRVSGVGIGVGDWARADDKANPISVIANNARLIITESS
jgi:hypothetical protein